MDMARVKECRPKDSSASAEGHGGLPIEVERCCFPLALAWIKHQPELECAAGRFDGRRPGRASGLRPPAPSRRRKAISASPRTSAPSRAKGAPKSLLQRRLWAQDQSPLADHHGTFWSNHFNFVNSSDGPSRQPYRRRPGRITASRLCPTARRWRSSPSGGRRRQAGRGRQMPGRCRDVVHRRSPVPARRSPTRPSPIPAARWTAVRFRQPVALPVTPRVGREISPAHLADRARMVRPDSSTKAPSRNANRAAAAPGNWRWVVGRLGRFWTGSWSSSVRCRKDAVRSRHQTRPSSPPPRTPAADTRNYPPQSTERAKRRSRPATTQRRRPMAA